MNLTTLDAIVIPDNRNRRDFDPVHILALQSSIQSKGLLSPIVLRNDRKTLVSGECRLKAIKELHRQDKPFNCNGERIPRDAVPFLCLAELTPLQLQEAEYEENSIRRDLSWVEKTAALAGLHKLRTAQQTGLGKVQTLVATASEIAGRAVSGGTPIASITDALFLDKFRDDPDVMGAKSAKEAVNIARKKVTAVHNAKLADQFKAENLVAPHTALLGDFLTVDLPSEVFDVIVTDPPYGINAHKMAPLSGSQAGTEHSYEDTPEYAAKIMTNIFFRGFRLCKPAAAFYMFCDFRWFAWAKENAALAGWTVWPTPIIGVKPSGGMIGDSSHGPRKAYEIVLFAYKGDKRTTGTYFDYFTMDQTDSKLHAAAKPVSAYVNLLKRSAVPGMQVLDPCMGSGTVFAAANLLSLKATGVEIDKAAFGTAVSRINSKE